jgi:hypothetical protein
VEDQDKEVDEECQGEARDEDEQAAENGEAPAEGKQAAEGQAAEEAKEVTVEQNTALILEGCDTRAARKGTLFVWCKV